MSLSLEQVVDRCLPDLLKSIKNVPLGHRPDRGLVSKFFIETFGVRCRVDDLKPFVDFALDVASVLPEFRKRFTPQAGAREVLRVLKGQMGNFQIDPFFWPTTIEANLLSCAKPRSLDCARSALLQFLQKRERVLFVIPYLNRAPEEDVLGPSVFWFRRQVDRQTLHVATGIVTAFLDFSKYPPDALVNEGIPLPEHGSYFGVIAAGWQEGLAALRRAAGAYCISLERREAGHRAAGRGPGVIFAIAADGAIGMRGQEPVMPQLINPQSVPAGFNARLLRAAQVRGPDREPSYASALSFISEGWLRLGTQAFLSYFIALDALFNDGSRNVERNIVAGVKERFPDASWRAPERARMLTLIRHQLAHGGATEIAATRYHKLYVREFGSDPLDDVFSIVTACAGAEPT